MLLTTMFQLTEFATLSNVRNAVPVPSGSPAPDGTSFAPLSATVKLMMAALADPAARPVAQAKAKANLSMDRIYPFLFSYQWARPEARARYPRDEAPPHRKLRADP